MARGKVNTNPLVLVALKDRVGEDHADDFSLRALLWLDAAKRGQLPPGGYNLLATTLLAAASIASQTNSKRFYDIVNTAYQMLCKAGTRPTQLLDLTTAEYQSIRSALSWYVKALPSVEVGVMARACARAEAMMVA
jgi:hypothetical protein